MSQITQTMPGTPKIATEILYFVPNFLDITINDVEKTSTPLFVEHKLSTFIKLYHIDILPMLYWVSSDIMMSLHYTAKVFRDICYI